MRKPRRPRIFFAYVHVPTLLRDDLLNGVPFEVVRDRARERSAKYWSGVGHLKTLKGAAVQHRVPRSSLKAATTTTMTTSTLVACLSASTTVAAAPAAQIELAPNRENNWIVDDVDIEEQLIRPPERAQQVVVWFVLFLLCCGLFWFVF